MTNESALDKNDVVAIVASSFIEVNSNAFNFLKAQLSTEHMSKDAVIILDCWRDWWGYGARSIRDIQNYVRSLGFNADRIKLRMLYDPRCPIRVTGSQPIRILTAAEARNAGFVLIVGGNGQALLQAAFSKAASSVVDTIAAATADPSCPIIIQSWSAGTTCLGMDTGHSPDKEKKLECSLSKFKDEQITTGLQFFNCSFAPHVQQHDLSRWAQYLSRHQERLCTHPLIPISDGVAFVIRRKGRASIVTDSFNVLLKQLLYLDSFRKASGFTTGYNLVSENVVCTEGDTRRIRLSLGPALKWK